MGSAKGLLGGTTGLNPGVTAGLNGDAAERDDPESAGVKPLTTSWISTEPFWEITDCRTVFGSFIRAVVNFCAAASPPTGNTTETLRDRGGVTPGGAAAAERGVGE